MDCKGEPKVETLDQKLKPCCACKPTKKMRDDCLFKFNEEKCAEFIEAHKECLRAKGFKAD